MKQITINEDALTCFFVLLMRDHVLIGDIYKVMNEIGDISNDDITLDKVSFQNEHMENMAKDMISRLI